MKKNSINTHDGKGEIGGSADTLLLCLYFVAACTYIPLSLFLNMGEWLLGVISLSVCLLSTAVLTRVAQSFRNVLGYSVILLVFIFFGGSLLPVGLLAAFTSSACVYAYLILKRPSPFLWGLPVIPLVISLFVIGSVWGAVASVSVLPCALLLPYAVKKQMGRVGAVCHISFGICAVTVLFFAAAVYSIYGELSMANAKALIDAMRAHMIAALDSVSAEMSQMMELEGSGIDLSSYITAAVTAAFNLLPAILITVANLVAYMIHSTFLSIYCKTDEERKASLPMLAFEMSLVSAVVFLACTVFAVVSVSDSMAMWRTAAENMMVVLAPGLILTALGALRMLTARKGPSCLGTLIYMLVIFMLISFSLPAIIITSVAGAVVVILAHIAKRSASKKDD